METKVRTRVNQAVLAALLPIVAEAVKAKNVPTITIHTVGPSYCFYCREGGHYETFIGGQFGMRRSGVVAIASNDNLCASNMHLLPGATFSMPIGAWLVEDCLFLGKKLLDIWNVVEEQALIEGANHG